MKKPQIKTIPYRCSKEKHREMLSMFKQNGTGFQKFMDEVSAAALAQWDLKKKWEAMKRRAIPPKKATALLRRIQARAKTKTNAA